MTKTRSISKLGNTDIVFFFQKMICDHDDLRTFNEQLKSFEKIFKTIIVYQKHYPENNVLFKRDVFFIAMCNKFREFYLAIYDEKLTKHYPLFRYFHKSLIEIAKYYGFSTRIVTKTIVM